MLDRSLIIIIVIISISICRKCTNTLFSAISWSDLPPTTSVIVKSLLCGDPLQRNASTSSASFGLLHDVLAAWFPSNMCFAAR